MAKRVSITTLNARSIDIINTIRANASQEYQDKVPKITTSKDIPAVGEALLGYPALANQFVSSLINRIAFVRIKSATFNNAYAKFKKGYLEFGETVEEVFVNIAKAREFSVEKAAAREFKRTLPDVKAAFHTLNWKVQYPVTVQYEDLRQAFTSADGVTNLITTIIDSVYTAAEYDEYLLFKYLLIKGISHGKLYPVSFDATDMKNAAKKFRGVSNDMTFMKTKYNFAKVHTTTSKNEQVIFMDSEFNAGYDVDVLASAFNMDKATFMGKLELIDDWTSFDNERFDEIRKNSTMIEEVTAEELALMKDVKAVLIDPEWFQVYDNLTTMSEQNVAAGLYWNYFLNIWKTVSSSPYSNAVVFVDDAAVLTLPESFTIKVADKTTGDIATTLTLDFAPEAAALGTRQYQFVQTESATTAGVAVHKYGAILYPAGAGTVDLELIVGDKHYTAAAVASTLNVGDTITFNAA